MKYFSTVLALSSLIGCGSTSSTDQEETGGSESGLTETGDSTPTGPMATGTIEMRDPEFGLSANVELWQAFSYFTDEATLVYATTSADASCDDVATMLTGEKEVDPNGIFQPNSCNLLLQSNFQPNRPNYDIQTDEGAIASIYCAFGDGEWEWKDGWKGERWYWGGQYYTASAWKGSLGLTQGEGDDSSLTVPIELREYEGNFPLDESGSAEEHKASGKLEGTLITEHCSKLKKTSWF